MKLIYEQSVPGRCGHRLPPKDVPAIVEQAIEVGAKSVWMQEGIVHHESAEKAEAAGLETLGEIVRAL